MYRAVGSAVYYAACPPCSYLDNGTCVWCADDGTQPGCEDCTGHRLPYVPWYKQKGILVTAGIGIATTVAAAVATSVAMKHLKV